MVDDEEKTQLTKDLGAIDFITKPNKFNDLVYILKRLIKLKHFDKAC
jgi:FixJ family two-component response regulator